MFVIHVSADKRNNQIGGANSKEALQGSVSTEELLPNPGNLWDILQFL